MSARELPVTIARRRSEWAALARIAAMAHEVLWRETYGERHPDPEDIRRVRRLEAAVSLLEPLAGDGEDDVSLTLPGTDWVELAEVTGEISRALESQSDASRIEAEAARNRLLAALPANLALEVAPMFRTCFRCDRRLPEAEFARFSTGAVSNRCRDCSSDGRHAVAPESV